MARKYANLQHEHRPHGWIAVLRWSVWDPLRGKRRREPPGPPAARLAPNLPLIHDPHGPPRLTWIGHATVLGCLQGAQFLIDPVFSEVIGWRCGARIAIRGTAHSAAERFRYLRQVAPGLLPDQLPPLAALLITHNHYDHLDAASLRALPLDVPVVVPAGLGRWFLKRRYARVTELEWWETVECGRLRITFVPSRHWSRRTPFDKNRSHWGGFVIQAGEHAVYHAGDTGWFDGFAEIGKRFPRLLAAMLPIGGYAPAWFMEQNHLNPEQAGRAFLQLGARYLIPIHWGTFALTDEPLCEPVQRLRSWWAGADIDPHQRLHVPAVGETVVLNVPT